MINCRTLHAVIMGLTAFKLLGVEDDGHNFCVLERYRRNGGNQPCRERGEQNPDNHDV
jgi:hypothetical protein